MIIGQVRQWGVKCDVDQYGRRTVELVNLQPSICGAGIDAIQARAGWPCSCGIGCAGVPSGSPGGAYLIDPGGSYYEWWFAGPLAGRVGLKAQSCPTSAAGAFQ